MCAAALLPIFFISIMKIFMTVDSFRNLSYLMARVYFYLMHTVYALYVITLLQPGRVNFDTTHILCQTSFHCAGLSCAF